MRSCSTPQSPRLTAQCHCPRARSGVPREGRNSFPTAGLPFFGAVICQSCPFCTVSVWCLGCFPSLPEGRTVSPRWLCARAQPTWPMAWQVFAWWLCRGRGPGCARTASLLLAGMSPEQGFVSSPSRSGGCTASGRGIGIAMLALLVGLGAAAGAGRGQGSLEGGLTSPSHLGGGTQPQPGGSPGPGRTGPVGGGAGARAGRGTALPGPGAAVGPGGASPRGPAGSRPRFPGEGGPCGTRSSLRPAEGCGAGGLCRSRLAGGGG